MSIIFFCCVVDIVNNKLWRFLDRYLPLMSVEFYFNRKLNYGQLIFFWQGYLLCLNFQDRSLLVFPLVFWETQSNSGLGKIEVHFCHTTVWASAVQGCWGGSPGSGMQASSVLLTCLSLNSVTLIWMGQYDWPPLVFILSDRKGNEGSCEYISPPQPHEGLIPEDAYITFTSHWPALSHPATKKAGEYSFYLGQA